MNTQSTQLIRRGITALGLIAIAIIHILDLPSKWQEVRYLGVAYIGAIITSLILAERLVMKRKKVTLDFYISALLSASILAGFTLTRTVGLPGAMDDIGNWLEPVGLVSIVVEILVIWNSLRAVKEIDTPAVAVVSSAKDFARAA